MSSNKLWGNSQYDDFMNPEKPSIREKLFEVADYGAKDKMFEVEDRSAYDIRSNINDGWSTLDFVVECRVNGMREDNLNEVYRHVDSILTPMNETFSNVDVVSMELFNRIHAKAMRRIYEDLVN